ncbi:TonB-dependent receptor [Pseudoduganella sp. LjRoot289]|uniref:TonB-dependent receptor plug domain-containing protein n=1 Tax=Pseudoduganella sp. LjRoot289 TaxID=3342314 RepID=UPI003ED0D93F
MTTCGRPFSWRPSWRPAWLPAWLPAGWMLGLLCALAASAAGAQGTDTRNEYFQMSLEELSEYRVTSVSKKEERLADAAASVYVITGEAIRRSGARSLPEALRLAPNLQVARIGASQYAISARGFNSSTANKLLVMIDGRTVYTPLYSGVFWDAQATMLPDVDRIEVVSGPGGTIWGTNAVNGVINIITRDAAKSAGTLLYADAGTDGGGVAARYGAALGEQGHYRIYASADRWPHSERVNGAAMPDAWRRKQAGFRADWHGARDDVSLLGDLYNGTEGLSTPGQTTIAGANLLLRWERPLGDGARLTAQTYLDHTERDVPGLFGESLNTADAELRYAFSHGSAETTVGGGYRVASDHVRNSALLAFLPAQRMLHWANLFAQQQRPLTPELRLIAGIRAESNDDTGIEWLPSVKLAWKAGAAQTLWAALARVVRAPARLDTDLYSPAKPPFMIAGGPDFKSELANKLELGWRAQGRSSLTYAATLFHSRYHRLRSTSRSAAGLVLDNQIAARATGLEAWASYQAAPDWTLDAGVLLQRQRLRGPVASAPPGNDPRHQFSAGSKWNAGAGWEFDLALRHVGALSTPAVPAYTAVDAHLGWRLSPALELRLSAADIFHRGHVEFRSGSGTASANPVRIERSLALALTARFP